MTYLQLSKRLLEIANDILDYSDANRKVDSVIPENSSFFIMILDILSDGDASCLKD